MLFDEPEMTFRGMTEDFVLPFTGLMFKRLFSCSIFCEAYILYQNVYEIDCLWFAIFYLTIVIAKYWSLEVFANSGYIINSSSLMLIYLQVFCMLC